MVRRMGFIAVFVLACGACGGDDDAVTSEAPPSPPDVAEPAVVSTEAAPAPTDAPVTAAEPEPTDATPPTEPDVTTAAEPAAAISPETILDQESFGASHALSGAIVDHDGEFHMFYVAGESNFGDVRIARATSSDAAAWTMADDRLLSSDDVPYSGDQILPASVVVLADGTWAMYFNTQRSIYGTRDAVIGMATAPAPEGPWTVSPEPVLTPAEADAWDSRGLGNPCVVLVGDGYMMWYDGHAGDQTSTRDRAIGIATSPDGMVWTRVGTDPVLVAGEPGAWDELRAFDPNVVVDDAGYVMSYATAETLGSRTNTGYGLAYSDDGVTWEKADDAFFWLIEDGEMVMPGLLGSLSSTMIAGPDGHRLMFDLLFPGYGETYAVAPPV